MIRIRRKGIAVVESEKGIYLKILFLNPLTPKRPFI